MAKVEQTTKTVKRRAASNDELACILKATRKGKLIEGLTGEQRYWLYRVAAATGFRASELRSLTPAAFKLQQAVPEIIVQGAYGLPKDEPVWSEDWNKRAAEMLRTDLDAAKIAFRTPDGVLDFHALRHTFVTSLKDHGVHPKDAQELARHKTIDLTMNYYTHLQTAKLAAVLPKAI